MGCYVNPQTGTKEEWLAENAQEMSGPPHWGQGFDPKEQLPVCLVDNGPFTAAAVAYCERELEDFNLPTDHRPKRWFMAPVKELNYVSDLLRRTGG